MITIITCIMITIIIIVITICCRVWNYVVDTYNKFDFLPTKCSGETSYT
jgi:hypothetical protein